MQVTIDNKTVRVPENILVVEAAKRASIHIPVFCYHPKLAPVGMCRMCLVEIGTPRRGKDGQIEKDAQGNPIIAWMPKLQTACTTIVSDGMAVRTDTAAVADARRAVLEFLLTSHPLDCPICDKGGECPLQDLTMAYGPGVSRFPVELKFHNEKRVPLGDLIMLDRERCIQCARCIRFQDEIADDPVLGFATRGRGMEIVALDDPPFNSKFSGNTIDICPVGALTSRDFRFAARVWEVNDTPSVCAHCSVGCNILISERDHQIKRIVPRENEAVNEVWLCDKGRFVHHFTAAADRLSAPLIRKNGNLERATWQEALELIAARFAEIKKQSGANALGGLGGDRAANEDLYLFQKLFRQIIGSNNLDHRVGWSATNVGVDWVRLYGAGAGTNLGRLDKNAAVLVLGADPEEEQPVIRLRLSSSARTFGANLIVANGRITKLAAHAKQSIIYRYGAEAAFLLGIVRAILDENLENKEFIAARVTNFDAFKKSLKPYTLTRSAEMCGVNAEEIRNAARAFAQSRDALILFGREMMVAQQRDPIVASAMAVLLLVTGHVGRANSGVIALYPHNNSTGAIDFGLLPDYGLGRVKIADDQRGMSAAEMTSGRVRALYVMACDPAADGGFVKPGFLVVQDLFLTETAKLADVVLPAQSFAERDGTCTNTERRVQLFHAAIKPISESKPDWWIIAEAAKRLGALWPYKNPADVMNEIAATVPLYSGMTSDALAENVRTSPPQYWLGNPSDEPVLLALGELENISSGKQWLSVAESEPSAKFELIWNEPSQQLKVDRGQLVLAVSRSLYDRGTLVSKTQIVQPRVPAPFVEINSHDAEELAIGNGARVHISFDSRIIDLNAKVDGHVPPGVALIAQNLDGIGALPLGARVKVEKIK